MPDSTRPPVDPLERAPITVLNAADLDEVNHREGRWGGSHVVLTPNTRTLGRGLGVNQSRLPPGCALVPFHFHMREDEVFYILTGRGILRAGDTLRPLGPGDCISCPAGTKVAHQIANPFDEDLVYLAIGGHDPHEVCGFPDTGKTFVRALGQVGRLDPQPYMAGEPDVPGIFALIDAAGLQP